MIQNLIKKITEDITEKLSQALDDWFVDVLGQEVYEKFKGNDAATIKRYKMEKIGDGKMDSTSEFVLKEDGKIVSTATLTMTYENPIGFSLSHNPPSDEPDTTNAGRAQGK